MIVNMKTVNNLYKAGTLPELGTVPEKMYAWTLRSENLGEPLHAFREEIVDTPMPRKGEVLVAVISAGINYNGIWASKGQPKNVVESNGDYGDKREPFHICGSEASGIVYATGEGVENVSVGDRVIISGTRYDTECEFIKSGAEPEYSPTFHIWGYESNWGAFAQFTRVYSFQCIKMPEELGWDEASSFGATAVPVNRMLTHWKGNEIKKNDVVLIWGGAGGLGSSAIQQSVAYGAVPVAVVSDAERGEYCKSLGAKGYILRTKYSHWGNVSDMDSSEYRKWLISATKFRNEIYSIVGERRNPAIVIEHPGSDTLPTSLFVCGNGGMIALCGATSGYIASVDLRYLWMYQKRIQGSHGGSADDFRNYLKIKKQAGIKDVISKVYQWNELPLAHHELSKGVFNGKAVVRIVPENYIKETVFL